MRYFAINNRAHVVGAVQISQVTMQSVSTHDLRDRKLFSDLFRGLNVKTFDSSPSTPVDLERHRVAQAIVLGV
jgi:hypothetical protein